MILLARGPVARLRAVSFPRWHRAALAATLAALAFAAAACSDRGDPVQPSQSITGRWQVVKAGGDDIQLELQELPGGGLAGKFLVFRDGVSVGEISLTDGTASGGSFSLRLDPLDPPVFPFLERFGNAGVFRLSGSLQTRETLLIEFDQECARDTCLLAGADAPLSAGLFSGEAAISRPLGLDGYAALIAFSQNGSALTGVVQFIYGSTQGGLPIAALPVRDGVVSDSNAVTFRLDPADDPTGALAESLGCAAPIVVFGRPDQGSLIRYFARQEIETETDVCHQGTFSVSGVPVFNGFRQTFPTVIDGDSYDVTLVTTQLGSVVEGTVTFENDSVREGPFTIENGRFAFGFLSFVVRPGELESVAFVRALGSAAPIRFVLRVAGGLVSETTAQQACPCLRESIVVPRIRVGL